MIYAFFYLFLFKNHFLLIFFFTFCWDKLDYPGSIVYLSCCTEIASFNIWMFYFILIWLTRIWLYCLVSQTVMMLISTFCLQVCCVTNKPKGHENWLTMEFSNCHIEWKNEEKCSFMPNVKLDNFTLPFQEKRAWIYFFDLVTFKCVKRLEHYSF